MLNTVFRADVFVRGARRMPAASRAQWLQRIGLALLVAQYAMLEDRYQALASPVLRTGVETTQIERLVFHHLQEQPECRDGCGTCWLRSGRRAGAWPTCATRCRASSNGSCPSGDSSGSSEKV